MVSGKLKAEEPHVDDINVFQNPSGFPLLKIAAVYGANASGKSNLMHALSFMRRFVLNSSKNTQTGEEIEVERFLLDTHSSKEPAYFEIVFFELGIQYRYGFEINDKEVVSEWLYHIPKKQESRLFIRNGQEVKPAKNFAEGSGLKGITRNNALHLSVLAQFNGPISQKVLSWFRRYNVISGLKDSGYKFYTLECLDNPDKRNDVVAFVKSLDLNILDISSQTLPVTPSDLPEKMPLPIKSLLKDEGWSSTTITTRHNVYDHNGARIEYKYFDMDKQESHGTQKLFALAGPIIDTLKHGKFLAIDEFDSQLHPNLTRALVKLFQSSTSNPKNAQLIFTTHNTNILDRHLFRRDQLWFIEKDRFEASNISSLAEFRIRNDASFEDLYLNGRIGSVPFLSDLSHIFESDNE